MLAAPAQRQKIEPDTQTDRQTGTRDWHSELHPGKMLKEMARDTTIYCSGSHTIHRRWENANEGIVALIARISDVMMQ